MTQRPVKMTLVFKFHKPFYFKKNWYCILEMHFNFFKQNPLSWDAEGKGEDFQTIGKVCHAHVEYLYYCSVRCFKAKTLLSAACYLIYRDI